MTKPICTAESTWKYWNEEKHNFRGHRREYAKYCKTQMVRSKRRYLKKIRESNE